MEPQTQSTNQSVPSEMQQSTRVTQPTQKLPWPFWSLLGVTILFGPVAAFLVSWKNIERLGQIDKSKEFFKKGGVICALMVLTFLSLYPEIVSSDILKYFGQSMGIIFPVWFQYGLLPKLPDYDNKSTKVDLALLGWGVLGMVITIVAAIVVSIVMSMIIG